MKEIKVFCPMRNEYCPFCGRDGQCYFYSDLESAEKCGTEEDIDFTDDIEEW